MRYFIFFISVLSIGLFPLVPYSWSNHKVGDPTLEQLPIWNQCCHDHDCVPQKVKIIGKQGREKISVEIEGTAVSVFKPKREDQQSKHSLRSVSTADRNH